MSDLKAAAERLGNDAKQIIAEEYLRLTDPTAVDEAWLREIGFKITDHGFSMSLQTDGFIVTRSDKGNWYLSYQGLTGVPAIETRGQLRMLASAIGISLTEYGI